MPALVSFLWLAAAAARPSVPVPDPLAHAPSRFAHLDGMRVHFKSLGRGKQALVLVHGWTCDMGFWRYQVPAFTPRTRVIVLDLPGHGRSDKPEIAYTIDLFARAVLAVLRDAGVEQAVLAGHSMGATVVRQVYRLEPQRVRGLVLVDGTLRPFFKDVEQARKWAALYRTPEYRQNAARAIDGMMSDKTPAALREEIKAAMLSAPQHVMASAAESMMDPALYAADPIRVPLVVVVSDSPLWGGYEEFLRSLAPALDYHAVTDVGHFLMLEKPAEVNATLAEALTRRGLLKN